MDKLDKCFFCDSRQLGDIQPIHLGMVGYKCPTCGWVHLGIKTPGLLVYLKGLSDREKHIASICFRNEHERRKCNPPHEPLFQDDLELMIKQYRALDAIERMDKALENIHDNSPLIGQDVAINLNSDYPYYHCFSPDELHSILTFLQKRELIENIARTNFFITAKGYERLRELKRSGKDSRQCFVAMWFTPDMADVYENAVRSAIEYIEDDQTEPRFKALKIDQKEHTNDINDEIIAEIRRSRFMVCDLTGYRGGVYWEAGFANGLGLEVIYTCREDWVRPETTKLKLINGSEVEAKREGIHFDLEHRNRIEWKPDDLPAFRDRLNKRIKAVIV